MEIIWYGHVVGTLEDTQVETTGLRAGDRLFHKIGGRWISRGTTASTACVRQ